VTSTLDLLPTDGALEGWRTAPHGGLVRLVFARTGPNSVPQSSSREANFTESFLQVEVPSGQRLGRPPWCFPGARRWPACHGRTGWYGALPAATRTGGKSERKGGRRSRKRRKQEEIPGAMIRRRPPRPLRVGGWKRQEQRRRLRKESDMQLGRKEGKRRVVWPETDKRKDRKKGGEHREQAQPRPNGRQSGGHGGALRIASTGVKRKGMVRVEITAMGKSQAVCRE